MGTLYPRDWRPRRRLPWWARIEVLLPVAVLIYTLIRSAGR